MKKIIIFILFTLAMASCMDKNALVVEDPAPGDVQTYIAPLEISVGVNAAKSFDEDMKWTWENTDNIYGYQASGAKTVNTLTLKENDRFGTENFTYASKDPATFHFVYAGDATLDASASGNRAITQKSAQSGKWSPVLVGSAINKTFTQVNSDNTTIGLEHLSAALEVRLWKEDVDKNNLTDAYKKHIASAELRSNTKNFLLDIVPAYNHDGTVTYSQRERGKDEELGAYITITMVNSPTVVFNIAPHAENYSEGDLTLAIIDENGDKYVLAVPALNFVAGKRTILNVVWKPQTSAYLPDGETFNSAIDAFMTGKGITAIKFITNSAVSSTDVLVENSIYMVQNENTLEIHTAASQYVANSNCRKMFDSRLSWDSNTKEYIYNSLQQITAIDFSDNFNTHEVTDMCCMLYGCSSLTALDISCFNTENVTNMMAMFFGCSKLTSLDVSNFNTENVDDMGYMFCDCSGLTTLDLSNFNTEKVTYMGYMFSGCSGLTSLDVSNFNTEKVTYMGDMFAGCSGLTSLDVSNLNTENVDDMGYMFYDCSGLTTLDLSNFNTEKVTYMSRMFTGCSGLTSLDVSNFNTEKVTDMKCMFKNCSGLTSLDVSNFNTEKVTKMVEMFYNCSKLASLNLSNFKTANVTDMESMFSGCSMLTSLNLSNFNFTSDPNLYGMFLNTGKDAENKPIPIYVTATGKQYIETKGDSDINNTYAILTIYDKSGFGVPNGENNGDENWSWPSPVQ